MNRENNHGWCAAAVWPLSTFHLFASYQGYGEGCRENKLASFKNYVNIQEGNPFVTNAKANQL